MSGILAGQGIEVTGFPGISMLCSNPLFTSSADFLQSITMTMTVMKVKIMKTITLLMRKSTWVILRMREYRRHDDFYER